MRIQRIENERPTPKAPVTVKVCGNVIEVRHSGQGAPEITIEKLSADEYLDKRTGEIKEFQHTENRRRTRQAWRRPFATSETS